MEEDLGIGTIRDLARAIGIEAIARHCDVEVHVVYAWIYSVRPPTEAEWTAVAALRERLADIPPRPRPADDGPARSVTQKMRARTVPPPHRVRTIAVVDDDDDHRTFVRKILEERDYDVFESHDGLHALETLESRAVVPDLMLLDLEMPTLSGAAMLDALETRVAFAGMPVLIVSASPPPSSLKGYHGALLKPIDPSVLIEIVTDLIGASDPRMRVSTRK